MIKRVKLHNFQSHKDTVLDLCPSGNSIIGISDSGKSAFLRAIDCIGYRSPFYITNFETEGYVELEMDNATVRREVKYAYPKKCQSCKAEIGICLRCPACDAIIERSVVYDRYVIDGIPKEKFGVKLPEFLLDVLKFREMKFVDVEEKLQFASQHQDMFFIGPTYGGGARNKIISCLIPDSDKVDILLKKVGSEYQEKKIISESLLKDNIVIKTKIESGRSDFDAIESIEVSLQLMNRDLKLLLDRISRLKQIKSELNRLQKFVDQTEKVSKIGKNLQILDAGLTDKLLPLINKIYKLTEFKKLGKPIVLPKEDFQFPSFDDITRNIERATKLKDLKRNIVNALGMEMKSTEAVDCVTVELNKKKKEFNKQLGESHCPLIDDKYCDSCIERLKL